MKNRFLLCFCLGFVATCFACAVCENALSFITYLVIAAVCCFALLLTKEYKKCGMLFFVSIIFSVVWTQSFFLYDKIPEAFLKCRYIERAEVASYSEPTKLRDKISFTAKIDTEDKRISALVYADTKEKYLEPGDTVSFSASINEIENRDEFAEKTYYKSRGIDVIIYASNVVVTERADSLHIKYIPLYLREQLLKNSSELFSEEVAAFINSLVLGDKSGLSDEFQNDLKRTGLSHATSVSGMHIAFIMGMILVFSKRRHVKLFGLAAAILFTLVAGAPQSAMRAMIMLSLPIVADICKREYDPPTSISFAAFVLCLFNPYSITDTGFLLSFLATLGIILMCDKVFDSIKNTVNIKNGKLKHFAYSIFAVISVSVSATLFTTPITAYEFGQISVVSTIANVLLNSAISAAFSIGFFCIVLGFVFMPLAKVIAYIVEVLVLFIMNTIKNLSKLPFATVFTENISVVLLITFICVVIAYALYFGRKKVRLKFTVLSIALAVGATVLLSNLYAPKEENGGMRVDVLDVGQGQCIVATYGEYCAVIDCGGDKDAQSVARSHLAANGIRDVDALILTHAHSDHANGADGLVETTDVSAIYMPKTDESNSVFVKLVKRAGDESECVFVEKDTELELGDMTVKLITLPEGSDENENGLVVLLCDQEYEILITGDIPDSSEKLIAEKLPDCEAYVVGHHGSKTSSSYALLNTALPELSIVSVGSGNSYGHPADATLTRLQNIGSKVYRTDIDGTVTVYSREAKSK